jgi:hypothetical protein
MPDLSSLATKLSCLTCVKKFAPPEGEIRFQWGNVGSRYRVGETVRWLTRDNGDVVPAFRSVDDNLGSGHNLYYLHASCETSALTPSSKVARSARR